MKNYPEVGMKLPKQYFALWKDANGKWRQFDSNNMEVANKKAALNDGELYIDLRYAAKIRLYWFLVRKKLYPNEKTA